MPNTFDQTVFEGLTESELLNIRASAVASLTSTPGSTITSVTTRDLSTTFSVEATPQQILSACLWALQKLDSATYGTSLIRAKRKYVV